jgi:molybdenum cofactor cytidylyltransferase
MIQAIVLAAGKSRRMGEPKLALPWGDTTVLAHVISAVQAAEVDDVLVVLGSHRELLEPICREAGVRWIFNEDFETGEMLGSLQCGLRNLPPDADAALVVLGDQPQIQTSTVRGVLVEFTHTTAPIIVPSTGGHRGHPWLVRRSMWPEMLAMHAPDSPREFLNRHATQIGYVELNSPSIVQDIDTPQDYLKHRP